LREKRAHERKTAGLPFMKDLAPDPRLTGVLPGGFEVPAAILSTAMILSPKG
jgi:hypothetical protein